jgi:RecB family exonuclease
LVDEFQDSDKLQLQLLERIAGEDRARERATPEICFVGDFNQSIYRFRGATPENIAAARDEFRCSVLTLRTNRRSAHAILDVANRTPKLNPDSLTTAEDPALLGSVRLELAYSPDAEVARVCEFVETRIAAGTPAREIAVLLRVSEPYTSRIVAGLDARGIPVAARPAAGFLEDPAVGAVLTALRLVGDVENESLWTQLLTNPVIGFRAISVRMAFDAARRASLRNPIKALQANPPVGLRLFDDFLAAWRRVEREARRADAATLIASITREFDLLGPVRTGKTPPGWDPRSSPARLGVLAEAAADLEATSRALGAGRVSPARFVADIEEIAGLLSDPADVPPLESDGVRVMSIHAAKGLEFDVVVVPQALDGVLPQRERGHALLPPASLSALRKISPTLFAGEDEALQEECSLWYVALTRARREVLVTAAQADADDIELPLSPFARLIGPPALVSANGDARSGGTELDPDRVSSSRSRPETLQVTAGVQTRRPLTHTVEFLTPSTIEKYLACPRRFFYGQVLRLAPEIDDEVTLLGNLIHRVLARFHEDERDFTNADDLNARRARWQPALLALIDEFAPAAAQRAGVPFDSNFMRYELALARSYIAKYIEVLADEVVTQPFTVLACEFAVDSDIAGVRLRGRADRVDRLASGGLAIRDYKSGASNAKTAPAVRAALNALDKGEAVAGDAPEGLNLQTLLYIPGVEAEFGEPVVHVEYLYFRGKRHESKAIVKDTIEIAETGSLSEAGMLTRAEVARVQTDLAASVARALADGSVSAFSTALDVQTCRYCDFVHACPGALMVAP